MSDDKHKFLVLVGSQVEGNYQTVDAAIESARKINDQRIDDGGWMFDESIRVVEIIDTLDDECR